MKELMVRAIYCEMLGYEASFSYIHAIKLAQQGSALEKRVGVCVLFLNSVKETLYLCFAKAVYMWHLLCRLSGCVSLPERESRVASSPGEHCFEGECKLYAPHIFGYRTKLY